MASAAGQRDPDHRRQRGAAETRRPSAPAAAGPRPGPRSRRRPRGYGRRARRGRASPGEPCQRMRSPSGGRSGRPRIGSKAKSSLIAAAPPGAAWRRACRRRNRRRSSPPRAASPNPACGSPGHRANWCASRACDDRRADALAGAAGLDVAEVHRQQDMAAAGRARPRNSGSDAFRTVDPDIDDLAGDLVIGTDARR